MSYDTTWHESFYQFYAYLDVRGVQANGQRANSGNNTDYALVFSGDLEGLNKLKLSALVRICAIKIIDIYG